MLGQDQMIQESLGGILVQVLPRSGGQRGVVFNDHTRCLSVARALKNYILIPRW